MPQNAVIKPLPAEDFERYCLLLALQISAAGTKYDVAAVPMRGGLRVYANLQYSLHFRRPPILIDVSRYRDGETTSRHAPDFRDFPPDSAFEGLTVLVVEDVADDGDTTFELRNRIENARAKLVHVGVVICKSNNMKVGGWEPDFIGWRDEKGDVFWEFSGEVHEREFNAAKTVESEMIARSLTGQAEHQPN